MTEIGQELVTLIQLFHKPSLDWVNASSISHCLSIFRKLKLLLFHNYRAFIYLEHEWLVHAFYYYVT